MSDRQSDNRKLYPHGTRGCVTIEAETNAPQTRARGEEFAKVVGDAMTQARTMVAERLRDAGFTDCNVWVDTGESDLEYQWGTAAAIDVYEHRNRDLG